MLESLVAFGAGGIIRLSAVEGEAFPDSAAIGAARGVSSLETAFDGTRAPLSPLGDLCGRTRRMSTIICFTKSPSAEFGVVRRLGVMALLTGIRSRGGDLPCKPGRRVRNAR